MYILPYLHHTSHPMYILPYLHHTSHPMYILPYLHHTSHPMYTLPYLHHTSHPMYTLPYLHHTSHPMYILLYIPRINPICLLKGQHKIVVAASKVLNHISNILHDVKYMHKKRYIREQMRSIMTTMNIEPKHYRRPLDNFVSLAHNLINSDYNTKWLSHVTLTACIPFYYHSTGNSPL